jgi:cell division septal protein FtsQ
MVNDMRKVASTPEKEAYKMKKVKTAVFINLGILAALVLGVLALIYIPGPRFESDSFDV